MNALSARRTPPDPDAAGRLLTPDLFDLFAQMAPEDQRHALRVLGDVEAQGESAPALFQAALLHDVGKSRGGVRLGHRVARVALGRLWPAAWSWLSASPTGWRRPFWVLAHHPARGATWAETQGADAAVSALIRTHESPPPAAWAGTEMARWHAALARADSRS